MMECGLKVSQCTAGRVFRRFPEIEHVEEFRDEEVAGFEDEFLAADVDMEKTLEDRDF